MALRSFSSVVDKLFKQQSRTKQNTTLFRVCDLKREVYTENPVAFFVFSRSSSALYATRTQYECHRAVSCDTSTEPPSDGFPRVPSSAARRRGRLWLWCNRRYFRRSKQGLRTFCAGWTVIFFIYFSCSQFDFAILKVWPQLGPPPPTPPTRTTKHETRMIDACSLCP